MLQYTLSEIHTYIVVSRVNKISPLIIKVVKKLVRLSLIYRAYKFLPCRAEAHSSNAHRRHLNGGRRAKVTMEAQERLGLWERWEGHLVILRLPKELWYKSGSEGWVVCEGGCEKSLLAEVAVKYLYFSLTETIHDLKSLVPTYSLNSERRCRDTRIFNSVQARIKVIGSNHQLEYAAASFCAQSLLPCTEVVPISASVSSMVKAILLLFDAPGVLSPSRRPLWMPKTSLTLAVK